ncbi:myo-inositol 2-dehydrogenase-like isoform X1 [Protopterus annectens]|uniref:myo-inositol 2-dehydrogenase-like isoform X1 n=1 Tax=Protopterus annectens TaxID=7888 RepID=UPI001CFAAA94|nr:myo-inositol 2-dehydrogenase-like isoform X1 [Protopterus annectens]
MGRKKKTLHDYAAEFSDLAVKRHVIEHKESGESAVVETLYCKSCEIPMRVRRDRILEHLASGRHYRNNTLVKHHGGARVPLLLSSASELGVGLPSSRLDASPFVSQPSQFVLPASASISSSSNTSCSLQSPSSSYHQPFGSVRPSSISSTTNVVPIREDPSTSASSSSSISSHSQMITSMHVKSSPLPSRPSSQKLVVSEASNSIASAGTVGRFSNSGQVSGSIGLALFGVGNGSKALFQSLRDETGCFLLYIVEDQLHEVERAFGAEFLTSTRVLREQDADIVLNDQRVSGVIVCCPPDEALDVVIDALRAGKGVFCEKLPSFDRQTAESCFHEADRCGRPLICGFYKRFDPALQFLYKKVRDNQSLGKIHQISTVSRSYPAVSLDQVKKSGGIFYDVAVHDIDVVSWLLGESVPDIIFSLGHAFCSEMNTLKDADLATISMKFPSGAVVSLDISQHCTRNCDQRLEIHGSKGTLRMDNQNTLGISEYGTSSSFCSQSLAERYRDAYRMLVRHFLRTIQGKEAPFITKEQFLSTVKVAAAAEQSWQNGSAVDLRNEAMDVTVIKTEIQ